MEGRNGLNKLIVSFAGILIFISLAFIIDLNGFMSLSPLLIVIGIGMIFFSDDINKRISFKTINKKIILTVSHIFIFVGSKVYLDQYVEQFWLIYLVIGILLLNNSRAIVKVMQK